DRPAADRVGHDEVEHAWARRLGRAGVGRGGERGGGEDDEREAHGVHPFGASFPNSFITSCRSSQARFFSGGLRRRYAGWKVGMSFTPSYARHRPRCFEIGVGSRSSVCTAKRPSATTILGPTAAICALRNGSHASISSGSGSRFPGGRHFTTFAM